MSNSPDNRDCDCCFFCGAAWTGITRILSLSEREVEILQCIVDGEDVRQAALFLRISPRTVRTHLERVRVKFGVHTQAELVVQLSYAHLNWLCETSPPEGCRLYGRLAKLQ
jgi:DNA-binding CsgD family transcriptional regulator